MDFKGTKGKWTYHITGNGVVEYHNIKTEDGKVIALAYPNYVNDSELNANALLISKAPEMLFLLNDLLNDKGLNEVSKREINLLIKQATEL